MASYTVTTSKHATLTANSTDTVTLGTASASVTPRVEVLNRGSDPIYFTTDGTTPAVAGDNTRVVLPGGGLVVDLSPGAASTVKLIAVSAVPYSVSQAT